MKSDKSEQTISDLEAGGRIAALMARKDSTIKQAKNDRIRLIAVIAVLTTGLGVVCLVNCVPGIKGTSADDVTSFSVGYVAAVFAAATVVVTLPRWPGRRPNRATCEPEDIAALATYVCVDEEGFLLTDRGSRALAAFRALRTTSFT